MSLTPDQRAAHLARIEYMREMGMGHMSVTDPVVIVRMFRKVVQRDERERCAKIAEDIKGCLDPTMGCHEVVGKKIRDSK